MKDQNDKEPIEEHLKIKDNVRKIIEHMTKIKEYLGIDGIEYEIHINVTGTRVIGGVSYGGMNIKNGQPELVDLNFDGAQPGQTPTAPVTNAQLVDEMLNKLLK